MVSVDAAVMKIWVFLYLWVKEVDAWNHEGVDTGKHRVSVVAYRGEAWRRHHDNPVGSPSAKLYGEYRCTYMKLNIQFAVVEIALAGALIESGVISAGYSQVMPSHPIAKKLLKTKRKTAATIPSVVPP